MCKYIVITFSCFLAKLTFGQTPVEVAENILKVGGLSEEVFYYGFAAGDLLLFDFEEVNGKELKEIEIVEFPSSSKFMDYKTSRVVGKRISIPRASVYKFRFANSSIGGRVCKFKIQRIPANESTRSFNSSVLWREVFDTSYIPQQQRILVSSDTVLVPFVNKIIKVHSKTNSAGAKSIFDFSLPENTISWSYYVGVDQAGQTAFENAVTGFAKDAAAMAVKLPGYGPLAALALTGVSYFSQVQRGEAVNYYILDAANMSLFNSGRACYPIRQGKVVNDFAQMSKPNQGKYYWCFYNDNMVTGLTVTIKAEAVTVNEKWDTKTVQQAKITTKQEPYLSND